MTISCLADFSANDKLQQMLKWNTLKVLEYHVEADTG